MPASVLHASVEEDTLEIPIRTSQVTDENRYPRRA
jgi:hypothetical protein